MGEALASRQVIHQRRPDSSGRNGLALVMAQCSGPLAGNRAGRMCPQSQCCRGAHGVDMGLIPADSHKGDLSGIPHDHPKGLFSGGCIDFSICPAVRKA